jgi:hypothetical protein
MVTPPPAAQPSGTPLTVRRSRVGIRSGVTFFPAAEHVRVDDKPMGGPVSVCGMQDGATVTTRRGPGRIWEEVNE